MLKAIKIRLYPNEEQENYISNLLGSSRFVFNYCLSHKINCYNETKKNATFGELGKLITDLKKDENHLWLNDVHSKVLQQSIINLDIAYKNFFKNGNGFPKYKSRHNNKQSCRFPSDAIGKIKGNRITIIQKLKNIHFKCSVRDEKYLNNYQDIIKSGTLTKTKSGECYFSVLINIPNDKELVKTDNVVGIDLGIKDFVITSNSERFENIKIKRNNQKKLAKLHRELSRKVKGSNNRNKSRIKLVKYYEELNNKKENYLHQVSNQLLDENQVIIMENLNVKGMMKNHNLARSMQELSLYRFKEMLRYKSEWYGRDLIEIDRWFPSSKLCSNCGYKNNDLELKDRIWKCPECNTEHDRDINAALNILNEGKRLFKIKIGLSSPELTPLESSPLGSR